MKYHPNGKPITHDNPKTKPQCPKCSSRNVTKSGNVWDCLFCGELFHYPPPKPYVITFFLYDTNRDLYIRKASGAGDKIFVYTGNFIREWKFEMSQEVLVMRDEFRPLLLNK